MRNARDLARAGRVHGVRDLAWSTVRAVGSEEAGFHGLASRALYRIST
jgi:hypothetical protein